MGVSASAVRRQLCELLELTPPPLWSSAVHEASHAVMAHLVGLRVTRVEVRPDGSGMCEHTGSSRISPRERMLVCMAGPAGEARLAERSLIRELCRPRAGYRGDLNRITMALDQSRIAHYVDNGYDDAGASEAALMDLEQCVNITEQLVELNWGTIVRLAEELDEHGRLSGRAVRGLLS